MLITNLKRIYNDDQETTIHYDDFMLRDKFIFEETTEFVADSDIYTTISLKHYNNSDAFYFKLHEGMVLSPIQTSRILSDVINLYKDNSLNTFLRLVDELSISSMSSMSQTQEKTQREIREWIVDSFAEVW